MTHAATDRDEPGEAPPGGSALVAEAPVGLPAGATLAEALAALGPGRATGLLTVGGAGEVWLDEGRLYLACGPSSPSVVELLLAAEVGPVDQVDRWCQLAEAGGPPVLDQLAEAAPRSLDRLGRLLHEHNLGALFELMVPGAGGVELHREVRHPLGSRLAEPADELVALAAGRLELWRRIAERIPSTAAVFRMARRAPGGRARQVAPDEWAVLALLDGHHTVADVITGTGASAFRLCSLLYRLLLEDLIEPVPAP